MRGAVLVLMAAWLAACSAGPAPNPLVTMRTDYGDITIEVYARDAPVTAANFMSYVDDGSYDSAQFYRVVRDDNQAQNTVLIEVIQGGLGPDREALAKAPIAHEDTRRTGLRHRDGTVSLARGEPGTGRSEFFICIGDQPSLDFGGMRNPDGQGFAAFGQVVDGMQVVRQIQAAATIPPPDGPLEYTSGQMLVSPVKILSTRRAAAAR